MPESKFKVQESNQKMKIYTKVGDAGQTDLWGGGKLERRVAKSHPRVEAIGAVDELNAHLGLCAVCAPPGAQSGQDIPNDALTAQLVTLGARLFELGADVANPRSAGDPAQRLLAPTAESELEGWIDAFEQGLPPLRHFILPGGSERSARLQVARAVCRRTERSLVALAQAGEAVAPENLAFINRLGDWLFVAARVANQTAGAPEVIWRGGR